MTDRIKIIQIQKDRKQCIDTNGKIYNISDIEGHQDKFNVYVRRGIGPDKIKGIAWKSREAHQNKLRTYKLDIITEDKSSANEIIKAIIEYFADEHKVQIQHRFKQALGAGNIAKEIVNRDIQTPCMVVFDTGVVQSKYSEIEEITSVIKSCNISSSNATVIGVEPLCIEEMCLQFNRLISEISGLKQSGVNIIKSLDRYRITGDIHKFRNYDINSLKYSIGGYNPISHKKSLVIKGYNNISQEEQFIADVLAVITNNNPYKFNKRANECWYKDCEYVEKDNGDKVCALSKEIGIRRPNQPVGRCNKGLASDNKIEQIIHNQLFQVIYDVINDLTIKDGKHIQNIDTYRQITVK